MESETLLYGDDPGPEDFVPLDKLIPVKEQWLKAIDKAIHGIHEALSNK